MDFGLVSIITPCFNSEKTIIETYRSIAAQTYKNWEWIVIDDCSTDDTIGLLMSEIKEKDKVKILKMDSNSGAAKCRNKGIECSRGKYIAFLDSDDIWHKDKLLLQCKYMAINNYALSYTNYAIFGRKHKTMYYLPKSNSLTYRQLLRHCDMGCLTVMYDTEILGKVMMPENAEKREDYATWLSITKKGYVAHKLDIVLAKYRLAKGSVSSKKIKLIKYHWKVYRKCEGLSIFKSAFYIVCYIFYKLLLKY